jgi:alpha-tubulin suppressor-like RCC1 family protein
MKHLRIGSLLALAALGGVGVFAACGGDDTSNVDPDASLDTDAQNAGDGSTSADTSSGDAGSTDAGGDAADAAPICTATPCIVAIGAGGLHACAATSTGAVYCWGTNRVGELGSGTVIDGGLGVGSMSPPGTGMPTLVPGAPAANVLTAGGVYNVAQFASSCMRATTGGLLCWGGDPGGQLGRGRDAAILFDYTPRPAPAPVVGLANPSYLGTGSLHSCAVQGNDLLCWGDNEYFQLGHPVVDAAVPYDTVPVLTAMPPGRHATRVAGGYLHTCALLDDGTVACFGRDDSRQLGHDVDASGNSRLSDVVPTIVAGVAGATDVTAGMSHSCAVANGQVLCWGSNLYGQLGRTIDGGSTTTVALPVALPAGATATRVVAGADHTCAILSNRTVACWGINIRGALGADASTAQDAVPALVPGLTDVLTLASGVGRFTCALIEGGTVKCWGDNSSGQLGLGSPDAAGDNLPHSTPTPVVF